MATEVKSAMSDIKQTLAELKKRKEESVKGFRSEVAESHKSFDVLDGYSKEIATDNAEFRALLGGSTNSPPEDATAAHDEPVNKKGWLAGK